MSNFAKIDVANIVVASPAERALKVLSVAVYAFSAIVSLGAFVYGLLIARFRPSIWRSSIFRVLVAAQMLNFIRFVIRPIAVYTKTNVDIACRISLFLNNATTMLPVNLCIYCVIYLQLVVFHNVSPERRWPRVVLLTFSVLVSLVPISMYLFLDPSMADVDSFCNLRKIPSRKQYIFIICVLAMWEYLAGAVGIISVLALGYKIVKARRKTKVVFLESTQQKGSTAATNCSASAELLQQTLLSTIWFPITPILSLWLNILLLTVGYYTKRVYMPLEFLNVILLALQSFFLGIALVINPSVRCVYAAWTRQRRREKEEQDDSQGQTDTAESERALYRPRSMESLTLDEMARSPAFI
ncbi:hypothetical protein GGI18_001588 [Coemansia linderi]|uniref:Uncharacterized protein n=1 Tax=Coemansia linderi TaxID=2663919 RepID=A0ACC1KK88_9FUNG|nr:hypothetical protein GGI18_001588 [Coemansia linderi]